MLQIGPHFLFVEGLEWENMVLFFLENTNFFLIFFLQFSPFPSFPPENMEVDSHSADLGLGHSRSASYASQHSRGSGYGSNKSSPDSSVHSSVGSLVMGTSGLNLGHRRNHSSTSLSSFQRLNINNITGVSAVGAVAKKSYHRRNLSNTSAKSYIETTNTAALAVTPMKGRRSSVTSLKSFHSNSRSMCGCPGGCHVDDPPLTFGLLRRGM